MVCLKLNKASSGSRDFMKREYVISHTESKVQLYCYITHTVSLSLTVSSAVFKLLL